MPCARSITTQLFVVIAFALWAALWWSSHFEVNIGLRRDRLTSRIAMKTIGYYRETSLDNIDPISYLNNIHPLFLVGLRIMISSYLRTSCSFSFTNPMLSDGWTYQQIVSQLYQFHSDVRKKAESLTQAKNTIWSPSTDIHTSITASCFFDPREMIFS